MKQSQEEQKDTNLSFMAHSSEELRTCMSAASHSNVYTYTCDSPLKVQHSTDVRLPVVGVIELGDGLKCLTKTLGGEEDFVKAINTSEDGGI